MFSTSLTALLAARVSDREEAVTLIYGLNSILIVISATCLALRLYTRAFVIRALGADDGMAVVAFGFCVFQSSIDIYFVPLGSGQHVEDVDPVALARFYGLVSIMVMVLFWALLSVRLTCLLFLPRLCQERWYLGLVYGVGACAVGNTVVCFFLVLNACSPISDVWNFTKTNKNCQPQTYQAYIVWTNSIIGILTDFATLGLPIWIIIKNLRFSRAKALQVSLVFCVGFLSIICACIRLGLVMTIDVSVDTTFKFPRVSAWTEAELHLGFWVACVPAVKPLLRIVSFRLGFRTSPHETGYHPSTGDDSKFRVPSRASSRAFYDSLAAIDEELGRSKRSARDSIELVVLETQRGRVA